ncbi:hypothetical protein AMTRI_Chr07g29080 [Amborella trichopoda]
MLVYCDDYCTAMTICSLWSCIITIQIIDGWVNSTYRFNHVMSFPSLFINCLDGDGMNGHSYSMLIDNYSRPGSGMGGQDLPCWPRLPKPGSGPTYVPLGQTLASHSLALPTQPDPNT